MKKFSCPNWPQCECPDGTVSVNCPGLKNKELNLMLEKLKFMHTKFSITAEQVAFSADEKQFRIVAMQEELDEYAEADNQVDELDALVDLVIFALGTAERQGMLPIFEEAFNRVMMANCAKEVGPNKKRGSFAIDLKKPEGWKPPVLDDLFEKSPQQELPLGE